MRRLSVPLYVSAATAKPLQCPWRLPWVRAAIIGQPDVLESDFQILGDRLKTAHSELEVLWAPGHCDDHIVLYDRVEKVLIAGDAFMGSYFATPNPDVAVCDGSIPSSVCSRCRSTCWSRARPHAHDAR